MDGRVIQRTVARKLAPLLGRSRFKFAKGGRSSGKSHFFAENAVLALVDNPNARGLCIREVQRSLKFSAKHLIEKKIDSLGVSDYFEIYRDEIRSSRGTGLIAFSGMQDHTADSVKSFEDFSFSWFEESQRMSKRSAEILIPTIRAPGSELWFSWNPEEPTNAIEALAERERNTGRAIEVFINYVDNPLCPQEAKDEAESMRRSDPDAYDHIWLGGYVQHSKARILADRVRIEEFEPGTDWDGPYHGMDFGFSQDPLAAVRVWIHGRRIYVEHEAGGTGIENDDIVTEVCEGIPGAERFEIRCDNARPETISYISRNGLPRAVSCDKWKGSVRDGIAFLRSFEIVIHPRCKETEAEAKLYSYKTDRLSGQVLDDIIDAHNHYIDAIRYALDPMIKRGNYVIKRVEMI